uniref:Uncharacterized protein n=1 Tax=Saccharolobus islandicus TaxID=43080 RepID=Q5W2M2_SACIS|nr:hypothetical protein [Sulfolobus islandicus]
MLSEILKAFILVPAVIFLFYSAAYFLLFELNVDPKLSKFYRNASLTLLGGGVILLIIYMII